MIPELWTEGISFSSEFVQIAEMEDRNRVPMIGVRTAVALQFSKRY